MASLFHLLLLLLVQFPLFISAQTYKNITLGTSLSTHNETPYWSSPSGEFAFGFQAASGGEDLFLLAIWFANITEKTIVWTANEGNPVQGGSEVQLSTDGELSLSTPNGTKIWNAEPSDSGQVASAAMLNTGNFVLTSNDSSTLWESFDNPTDTLMPTQTLDSGHDLISRLTKVNYTEGRFKLSMQSDGNLMLYPLARPTDETYDAYWASGTVGDGTELVFNQSGYVYLSLKNGSKITFTTGVPASTREFYHRATLNFDGVLRQYTYPKSSTSSGGWSSLWSLPENICTTGFGEFGSGVCGFNSYCQLGDEEATCLCPPEYVYSDLNDKFGGCKQNFVTPSCESGRLQAGLRYEIKSLPNVDWPGGDYKRFQQQSEEMCKQTCLDDCLCAAAITGEGKCWLKKFPLSRGKTDPGVNRKAHIKVGNSTSSELVSPPPATERNKRGKDKWSIPVTIILGSLLLLVFLLLIYCSYHKKQFETRPGNSTFGINLRSFTYKELEEATNGFSEELGQGAFSTVYKGRVPSVTTRFIAVKKLEKIRQEVDKEFEAEVSAIGRTNHRNLVQLLGFCDEGTNRLLVYEYMKNGSLADFLFGKSRPGWYLRVQIAFGIAKGLAYLHEDCATQIIHCDVKPQNILIDDSFTAKISDFGLAKLLKSDQSRTDTGIRGTKGYVAPEWFKNMAITAKVDVYSFGIMLLEIICCRRNAEIKPGTEEMDILSDWAYECCLERKFHLLVENDEDAKNDKRLERFLMVAIWSIQEVPSLRPTMKKVTQMLEGAVEVLMPPDPSNFISSTG